MTPEKSLQRQALLAQRFVRLADTLVDDFDVVEVLDDLMGTCLDLLDVDQAGLLLTDPQGNLQRLASSSEEARLLELLQVQTREGPCFEAVQSGQTIIVDRIDETHDRWPTFAPRAVADGFRSVYAFPMRLRQEVIGSLGMFGADPGTLEPVEVQLVQALADVATIGLLQERAIHRGEVLTEQLQSALNSRIVIEQAKGVIAQTYGTTVDTAFEMIRTYCRRNHLRLSQVTREIVTDPSAIPDLTPPPGHPG